MLINKSCGRLNTAATVAMSLKKNSRLDVTTPITLTISLLEYDEMRSDESISEKLTNVIISAER